MNMEIVKKCKWPLITLMVFAGVFFFFYRFYHNDVKALAGFSASYKKFDKAISDFSVSVFASNLEGAPASDELERTADEVLVELSIKASARLSSLIKNDAKLMSITLEIANLSGKELDTLKTYKKAVADKNADLDRLAKELIDVTNKRKTAYARFRGLLGLKN